MQKKIILLILGLPSPTSPPVFIPILTHISRFVTYLICTFWQFKKSFFVFFWRTDKSYFPKKNSKMLLVQILEYIYKQQHTAIHRLVYLDYIEKVNLLNVLELNVDQTHWKETKIWVLVWLKMFLSKKKEVKKKLSSLLKLIMSRKCGKKNLLISFWFEYKMPVVIFPVQKVFPDFLFKKQKKRPLL